MRRPPSGHPDQPTWVAWAHEIGAWVLVVIIAAAIGAGIVSVWP